MQRYLVLEVSEGGQVSSFTSGEAGFIWIVGPLPEKFRKTPPHMIKEVRKFMRGVYDLNLRIWQEPRRNEEPLGVIISSIEGDVGGATILDDMDETSKELLSQIELYYRGPMGDVC